jgi:2-polyprenyl-3-methyl-5-hydroxy-6-metoxy-1,4-benzoquinol methylase
MNTVIELQRRYWNDWNASNREQRLSEVSLDQRDAVLDWLFGLDRTDLNILEVGCGAGWLCPSLKQFGEVTATDLSDEVLARASARVPGVKFIAGDFMELNFQREFDVIVTLEVLSHIADHDAFIAKLNALLRPGGYLMLATQNRPVLEKFNTVAPQQPGHLRRWFDRNELEALLSPHFTLLKIATLTPVANKGPMRLVAGRKAKRLVRAIAGRGPEKALASAGFGWTLAVLAMKHAP